MSYPTNMSINNYTLPCLDVNTSNKLQWEATRLGWQTFIQPLVDEWYAYASSNSIDDITRYTPIFADSQHNDLWELAEEFSGHLLQAKEHNYSNPVPDRFWPRNLAPNMSETIDRLKRKKETAQVVAFRLI